MGVFLGRTKMDLKLMFDENVVNYDKMRPTYVKELFADIINFSKVNHSKIALEIGVGTGQATLAFLQTGCATYAIEIGNNMTEFVKHKFANYKNFHVTNADFGDVQLNSNSYDLIYSGTAFHWIPQEIGYPKTFDLLKNGGTLALFWNHPYPYKSDEFYIKIQEVYSKYQNGIKSTVHKFSEEKCLNIVETMGKYGFTDTQYKVYRNTRVLTTQQYIALLNTYSDHRAFKSESRKALEAELTDVINQYGGTVEIQDTMDLYLAKKP